MERKYLTLQNKLDILDYAQDNGNKQAALQYDIQTKQIRDWRNKEQEIRAIPENKRRKLFTLHPGAEVKSEEAERLLSDWFNEMITVRNLPVSISSLMEKLQEFSNDYVDMTETALRAKVGRFMERHNLVLRRVNSYQAVPDDELQPVIDDFVEKVQEHIEVNNLTQSQIYNMDQTAIFFDMPPAYTVVERGIRRNTVMVNGSNYKKRATVLLLARADGMKFKPLIVFKAKPDARVAQEVREYDDDEAHHTVQGKAWTDTQVLETWNDEIWAPILADYPEKKLLLVDSLRLHKMNEDLLRNDDENVDISYIPEYCTAILQPLDIGVIKVFKQNFRNIWAQNPDVDITREMISTWIKDAWDKVRPEVISNSFFHYVRPLSEASFSDYTYSQDTTMDIE